MQLKIHLINKLFLLTVDFMSSVSFVFSLRNPLQRKQQAKQI